MEMNAVQAAESMPQQSSTEPNPIISLSDIVSALDVIVSQENVDRQTLDTIVNINEPDLRDRLVVWGTAGFPTTHVLYSMQFNRPEKCSDGIVRNNVLDYIQYLKPDVSLVGALNALETRLPGMALSYSYTNDFIVRVHVSRKD